MWVVSLVALVNAWLVVDQSSRFEATCPDQICRFGKRIYHDAISSYKPDIKLSALSNHPPFASTAKRRSVNFRRRESPISPKPGLLPVIVAGFTTFLHTPYFLHISSQVLGHSEPIQLCRCLVYFINPFFISLSIYCSRSQPENDGLTSYPSSCEESSSLKQPHGLFSARLRPSVSHTIEISKHTRGLRFLAGGPTDDPSVIRCLSLQSGGDAPLPHAR